MMYVEFIKKFFLDDSSELICVRVISVSWAQKRLIPLSRHDVSRVHKKFFSRWFAPSDGCWSHFGLLSLKTFDSHFHDRMYLEIMKSFFSPIRANWWVLESFRLPEPKTFDSHFLDMMYVKFIKIFFLGDSRELMNVRVIRPPEP